MIGIDLRGFRVVYEGVVYNALSCGTWEFDSPMDNRADGILPAEYLEIVVMDVDGRMKLLRDKADKFQFLRIIND